jgi:thiamine-phosphate pyrophosphorylase
VSESPPGAALAKARLYLVAGERITAGRVADLVPELGAAGVDVLQLREKELEAAAILEAGAEIARACEAAGLPFIVNDRPDIAAILGTGVHVGQDDLPVEHARRFVPGEIVGLSTHAPAEVDAACSGPEPPDYIAVGPVFETPTKPGRPAAGLDLVRYADEHCDLPWFAIGGIDEANLGEVMEAGGRRIVVVRAITEASDPVAAAARLRALLDDVPL